MCRNGQATQNGQPENILFIYRAWAFTDHTRLGYVLSRISLRSRRISLQFRISLRSLRFRTSLKVSHYPLFDSSLKIEIRKKNCPIIPTGISREFTISKFTSFFVNHNFLVNLICSDYLILFVKLIFFSLYAFFFSIFLLFMK